MQQVGDLKDVKCAVDCFLFHIPYGWKLIWKCGNVRPELVRAQKLLRCPDDFVEFAKLLRARGVVDVDESLSPMFYTNDAEKKWVFSEIGKLAEGQIEVLFGLSNMVHARWAACYDDRRCKMQPLAKSPSPLDFFILFEADGVALLDEVMMRDEMEKVARPKVYSHTEESQNVVQYLVTSDPSPTLAAGDEGWAMALAACILSEHGDAIPFDLCLSPVVPSHNWRELLEGASKGVKQCLIDIVHLVHKEWNRAAQFCRMLDDTGMPDEVNAVLKGRGVPPNSMRAYQHLEEICPLVVDIMSNLEARGLVRPRLLAGDVKTRHQEGWLLGLPEDNEKRMKFMAQCGEDGEAISEYHHSCVVWATKKKVDAKVAAKAANYFSRLPYSFSRISLRWGMVKALGGCLGKYVKFSDEEKIIGMRDLEQEMVFSYEYDGGWKGEDGKLVNIHPRFNMITLPDKEKSEEFDEAGHYFKQVKRQKLLEKIEAERYVLSNNTEEDAPERNRVRRERAERIARFEEKKRKDREAKEGGKGGNGEGKKGKWEGKGGNGEGKKGKWEGKKVGGVGKE